MLFMLLRSIQRDPLKGVPEVLPPQLASLPYLKNPFFHLLYNYIIIDTD